MKQYYLTSLYSQDMQVAVQQEHASKVLFRKFMEDDANKLEEFHIYKDYLDNHETTICLGVSQPMEILQFYSFLYKHQNIIKLPMGIFQERSLNLTATALTFVTTAKLSHPIMHEVRNIFKNNSIYSFYDVHNSCVLKNSNNSMTIDIDFDERAKPLFKISFTRNKFKSAQNEIVMPTELTDEALEKLYKELNDEDYQFHNGTRTKKINDLETITETYTIEELIFLDMLSKLRLKK